MPYSDSLFFVFQHVRCAERFLAYLNISLYGFMMNGINSKDMAKKQEIQLYEDKKIRSV